MSKDVTLWVWDSSAGAWVSAKGNASGQLVQGPTASNVAEVGNPVQIGGSVDDVSPVVAGEGNVRRGRVTTIGNWIVQLYNANNALNPISAMPGASEVKNTYKASATVSTTRATWLTPTSGKKVRVIALWILLQNTTANTIEVYFGTGTNLGTDVTKAIATCLLQSTNMPSITLSWPDGGGPVGAADDVVSIRTGNTDITNTLELVMQYREE